MAYLLFVDESGQDHHESPYEVLAGLAVRDSDLWNFITSIQQAEERHFGRRYRESGARELKAKKILKRKVFRHAVSETIIEPVERRALSLACLNDGAGVSRRHMAALAQSKLAFTEEVFELCSRYHCRVFASIVDPNSPVVAGGMLRKDYAYLFERFFYYLEDKGEENGLVVFDELERSQCHLLTGQMDRYFKETATGRQRSRLVIPEPFFVHSDLTTGIQVVDLAAYVIAWAVRVGGMDAPRREELDAYGQQVLGLRYRAVREKEGKADFKIDSLTYIADLRPRSEKQ